MDFLPTAWPAGAVRGGHTLQLSREVLPLGCRCRHLVAVDERLQRRGADELELNALVLRCR